jgi:hypothetical protein
MNKTQGNRSKHDQNQPNYLSERVLGKQAGKVHRGKARGAE